jgi:antitoxin component YwqK of YwqJK toxin-antitoxin module
LLIRNVYVKFTLNKSKVERVSKHLKHKVMKTSHYIISIILILLGINVASQNIYEDSNGIYYASNMEPYNGTYMQYYENGNIKTEYHFTEGVLNGITTLYFENGQKKEVRSYKNGRKDGIWYLWNIEGVKISQAYYKNNKKDGLWIIWDNEGNLLYEIEYSRGERSVSQSKYGSI